MASVVYKIMTATQWSEFDTTRLFRGAEIDLEDGYIHFSTSDQMMETAKRYFAGRADLILVAVDASKLGAALKFEPSRGGDLFPHLYSPLQIDAVIWAKPLPLNNKGVHAFPDVVR